MESSNYYWLWLSSLVKITPRKRYELLKYFGDPALIWHAEQRELETFDFLSPGDISLLLDKEPRKNVDELYEKVCKSDIDIINLHSPQYPQMLKFIYDPPCVIFARGSLEPAERIISIVGSRRATQYGLDTSFKLARGLSGYGFSIASGMARGIDTYAHKGAIAASGRTVAVLGCGLDTVYPPENRKLMQDIIQNGAVISEYIPGTPPAAYNFPARNRIISGISVSVVIVEAGEKSGSLITTDYALEQGREVFSVPGNIDSAVSTGTNRLIRDGAKIVTSIYDILDELGVDYEAGAKAGDKKPAPCLSYLDNEEKKVVKCLKKGAQDINQISRACGLEINLASSVLLTLELKAVVEQLPGKQYRLVL